MSWKESFYPESRFGGFTDIDGTIAFYGRVNALISPSFTVLEVGCGRGKHKEDPIDFRRNLRILKGKVKKIIGIDIDKAAEENPFLDEFYLIEGYHWPLENDSIDIILCDSVLEHIDEPNNFFSEARRVLRNEGYICIRTANSSSYIVLFSKLIPNEYHSRITHIVQDAVKEEDVFPTVYRCNSIRQIKEMLSQYDFEYAVYGYEAEPSYLSFSKIVYWIGVLHQRFAPGFLKPAIFAFGKVKKTVP
jgi:SAM-dependent methyltransferase